jgi:serine/threonine-protein kinase HipA
LKCLFCGQPIKDSSSNAEVENGWHDRCTKSFFGTNTMPALDISEGQLLELADAAVNQGRLSNWVYP